MALFHTVNSFGVTGIKELTPDEVDQTSGGLPFVVAAAITFYGTEIAWAAGAIAGGVTMAVALSD